MSGEKKCGSDNDAPAAYRMLQESVKQFRQTECNSTNEARCFSLDGRNGQLSQRKLAEAIDFLHRYGFVCIESAPGDGSLLASDCARLLEETSVARPPAHIAFAFLRQAAQQQQQQQQEQQQQQKQAPPANAPPETGSGVKLAPARGKLTGGKTSAEVRQVLTDLVHDYEPDALAHSQAAWNLRCNTTVRQFFSHLYVGNDSIVDQLLPSIESLLCVVAPTTPPVAAVKEASDAKREKRGVESAAAGATPIAACGASPKTFPVAPTFYYNVAWARAPHVIAAYHLHAHDTAIQQSFAEYAQQMAVLCAQGAKEKTGAGAAQRQAFFAAYHRLKERWLQRVRKEIALTARKVILGKRSTNKMVQDGAFHSGKKSQGRGERTTPVAESDAAIDDAEAIRALQSSFDATIMLGRRTEHGQQAEPGAALRINVVPGFQNYFLHYLHGSREKWAQSSGECVDGIDNNVPAERFSTPLFDANAVTVALRPGSLLIMNRNVPRWLCNVQTDNDRDSEAAVAAAGFADAWLLPVSYRWQCDTMASTAAAQKLRGANLAAVDCDQQTLLSVARICPMEIALSETYCKSIADGLVYSSLPHLTGAAFFARSTRKTASELHLQRSRACDAWLASIGNRTALSPQHYYRPPTLPAYLSELLSRETQLLDILDTQIVNAAQAAATNVPEAMPEPATTTETLAVAKKPAPSETTRKVSPKRFATRANYRALQQSQQKKRKSLQSADARRAKRANTRRSTSDRRTENVHVNNDIHTDELVDNVKATDCDNVKPNDCDTVKATDFVATSDCEEFDFFSTDNWRSLSSPLDAQVSRVGIVYDKTAAAAVGSVTERDNYSAAAVALRADVGLDQQLDDAELKNFFQ